MLPMMSPVVRILVGGILEMMSYLLRLNSSRGAEHIGQQLVAGMICLKPCHPPRSLSNGSIPGSLLVMCVSMFSLDDLFYVFLRLVSISLWSWNADYREYLGCGLPDEITLCYYVL